MTDDNSITWQRVDLLLAGMLHSSFPPASFVCPTDEPLYLYPILERALAACGLGDKAADIHHALREIVQPHFAKWLEKFELERRRIIGTADDDVNS
jgi:hypothetical protein